MLLRRSPDSVAEQKGLSLTWCQKPLTLKVPNTTIAEFANTVDPDEKAHNEPSHLNPQCLLSSLCFST